MLTKTLSLKSLEFREMVQVCLRFSLRTLISMVPRLDLFSVWAAPTPEIPPATTPAAVIFKKFLLVLSAILSPFE
jgi:hypothetical protein